MEETVSLKDFMHSFFKKCINEKLKDEDPKKFLVCNDEIGSNLDNYLSAVVRTPFQYQMHLNQQDMDNVPLAVPPPRGPPKVKQGHMPSSKDVDKFTSNGQQQPVNNFANASDPKSHIIYYHIASDGVTSNINFLRYRFDTHYIYTYIEEISNENLNLVVSVKTNEVATRMCVNVDYLD